MSEFRNDGGRRVTPACFTPWGDANATASYIAGSSRCGNTPPRRCADCSKHGAMKALRIVTLIALGVSCHLDKLLNGGGSAASPVSNGTPVALMFSRQPSSPRAGPIGPVQVSVVDSAGQPVAGVESTTVAIALGSNP